MLTITPGMISRLIDVARQRFVAKCLPLLNSEFPQLRTRYTEAELEQMLYAHCQYSKIYGIETAAGIYTLLGFRIRLAWSFPEGPEYAWAREILSRQLMSEDERVAALEQHLWGIEDDLA